MFGFDVKSMTRIDADTLRLPERERERDLDYKTPTNKFAYILGVKDDQNLSINATHFAGNCQMVRLCPNPITQSGPPALSDEYPMRQSK